MARHNEILTQFQEITPTFDYSNEVHINLVRLEAHLLIRKPCGTTINCECFHLLALHGSNKSCRHFE